MTGWSTFIGMLFALVFLFPLAPREGVAQEIHLLGGTAPLDRSNLLEQGGDGL